MELAVYLDKACHRRGIGRILCEALLAQLQAQGFTVAYAGITVPNPPSVGLFEAIGFARIGLFKACGFKSGTWHDVGFWELRLALPASPREPIPWPQMPQFQMVSHQI